MKCSAARTLIDKYMDGVISNDEAYALNNHVLGCECCEDDVVLSDLILDELLADAEIIFNAPDTFVDNVMSQISALNFNHSVLSKSRIENIKSTLWGIYSILLGFGVIVYVYRDKIIEALVNNQYIGEYVKNLIPSITIVNEQINYIALKASSFSTLAVEFMGSIRFLFLVALIVSIMIQLFVHNKSQDKVNL